jgi:hypothetical protein
MAKGDGHLVRGILAAVNRNASSTAEVSDRIRRR